MHRFILNSQSPEETDMSRSRGEGTAQGFTTSGCAQWTRNRARITSREANAGSPTPITIRKRIEYLRYAPDSPIAKS